MKNEQCICNHGDVENTCFPLTRCACKVHGKFNTMTNDLNNFLEREQQEFKNQKFPDNQWLMEIQCLGFIKDHDTRLINFVLSLVEKEVEKTKARQYPVSTIDEIFEEGFYECKESVSTIINNLRV